MYGEHGWMRSFQPSNIRIRLKCYLCYTVSYQSICLDYLVTLCQDVLVSRGVFFPHTYTFGRTWQSVEQLTGLSFTKVNFFSYKQVASTHSLGMIFRCFNSENYLQPMDPSERQKKCREPSTLWCPTSNRCIIADRV